MSLSQPSRTIVVEPIQASTAARPAEPPAETPPRSEPPLAPGPPAHTAAGS
jgi:hypothetical protein